MKMDLATADLAGDWILYMRDGTEWRVDGVKQRDVPSIEFTYEPFRRQVPRVRDHDTGAELSVTRINLPPLRWWHRRR